MSVDFSTLAERDLEEISDYIAKDSPRRALSFIEGIETLCQTLDVEPLRYEAADGLAPGLRRAIHGRYLIFYTVAGETIRIERILHGARDIKSEASPPSDNEKARSSRSGPRRFGGGRAA